MFADLHLFFCRKVPEIIEVLIDCSKEALGGSVIKIDGEFGRRLFYDIFLQRTTAEEKIDSQTQKKVGEK